MIVVEGPDCSGKTSLAAGIEADWPYLNYRRAPALSSTKGANEDVCDWWELELERPAWERMHGVYDRCFAISEPIYTPVTMRVPNCSAEVLAAMINRLIKQRPTIIFCLPDWLRIKAAQDEIQNRDKPVLDSLPHRGQLLVYWAYYNQMVLWAAILNTSTRKLVHQYDWQNREEIREVIAKYAVDHSF